MYLSTPLYVSFPSIAKIMVFLLAAFSRRQEFQAHCSWLKIYFNSFLYFYVLKSFLCTKSPSIHFLCTSPPSPYGTVLAGGGDVSSVVDVGGAGYGVGVGQAGQLLPVVTVQNDATILSGSVHTLLSHLQRIVEYAKCRPHRI
jgi:hypothetical protein